MGRSTDEFVKYPRTPHLFGSRGTDDDRHMGEAESLRLLADASLIVEEKLDGTNVGIHFDNDGQMALQCRGHLITEGMHPQYDLFKQWTVVKRPVLEDRLRDRYILFGEWVYARHSVHYRRLPHDFFEFDIYDKEFGTFLDLDRRMEHAGRIGDSDRAGDPSRGDRPRLPPRADRAFPVRQPIREPVVGADRRPDGRAVPADRGGRGRDREGQGRPPRVRGTDELSVVCPESDVPEGVRAEGAERPSASRARWTCRSSASWRA